MKTAVSVPDATFLRVNEGAAALGMSRSEFFATAGEAYLESLDTATLRDRIDATLASVRADPDTQAAVAVGRRRLVEDDKGW